MNECYQLQVARIRPRFQLELNILRQDLSLLQGANLRKTLDHRYVRQPVSGILARRQLRFSTVQSNRNVHVRLIIKSQPAENNELLLSVSDTGVGLPRHEADQIFNAFFTTKTHGTGMGLRISRSIVESHGGRLWAADNSPRGASFYFTLPTKAEADE